MRGGRLRLLPITDANRIEPDTTGFRPEFLDTSRHYNSWQLLRTEPDVRPNSCIRFASE